MNAGSVHPDAGSGTSRVLRLVIIVSVVAGLAIASAPHVRAAPTPPSPRVIATSTDLVSGAMTDGHYLLWTVQLPGTHPDVTEGDIYLADLTTGEVRPFAAGPGDQTLGCQISDGHVVWSDSNPVNGQLPGEFFTDLSSGATVRLVPRPVYCPTIAGDRVAHLRFELDNFAYQTIWVNDLDAPDQPIALTTLIGDIGDIRGLGFDGEHVVWFQRVCCTGIGSPSHWQLRMQGVNDTESVVLDEGWASATAALSVSIIGDRVLSTPLWPDSATLSDPGRFMRSASLATGDVEYWPEPVTDAGYGCWPGASANDRGVWGLCSGYNTLWTNDFAMHSLYTVALPWDFESEKVPSLPSWGGSSIVWVEQRGEHEWAVMMLDATHLSPSTPQPAPDILDPEYTTWYPETGHAIQRGPKIIWETNGGLPVFGYPITSEYQAINRDTGGWNQVQYTERQRFEWRPENAGTPYEVLLGRLGAELLEHQGRDWTTFPPADPSTPHYMAATGHAIAPEFWDYWSGHGLDLGDPDVSFRESLALFGYPLSEPMVETNADGSTVLTQYFERAVFEWHVDNPDPWSVLLRRLGAETLEERGWF